MVGIHDIRVFNFAILDIIGTIIIVYMLYKYKIIKASVPTIIVGTVFITIAAHVIFKVDTTLNYKLGLSNKPKRYVDNYKMFDIVSE